MTTPNPADVKTVDQLCRAMLDHLADLLGEEPTTDEEWSDPDPAAVAIRDGLRDRIGALLAGRLLPEGGDTVDEWRVVYITGRTEVVWSRGYGRTGSDESLEGARRHYPDAYLKIRTATIWPGGRSLTGPWTPEGTDG